MTRAVWDQEYRDGRWDYLCGTDEATRHRAIAAYAAKAGSVLDLGCGNGMLYEALGGPRFPGRYVGVDWALPALPSGHRPDRHLFVCGSLDALPVRGKFDVIVLSEVLYYLEDPIGVLRALPDHGSLVISVYQPKRGRWVEVVRELDSVLAGEFPMIRRELVVEGTRTWQLSIVDGGVR